MDDAFPASWGVAKRMTAVIDELDPSRPAQGPHFPREFAKKLYAYEALLDAPVPREQDPEPYSLQWFLDIEQKRHTRQGRWIPKVLEFAKHSGEKLLGLGHGLGTDWAQYAQNGAHVIVCASSPLQMRLVRRNFEVRNLEGRFVLGQPSRLPFDTGSIDVAFLSSLTQGIENPEAVIDEVFRVLKPGGKVLAVTSARYDVDYWFNSVFFWYRWFFNDVQPAQRPADEDRYSGRQLRRMFAKFIEHRVYKRQLRRSEIPHVWRVLPTPLLSRVMGRILVLKAFKPVRGTSDE